MHVEYNIIRASRGERSTIALVAHSDEVITQLLHYVRCITRLDRLWVMGDKYCLCRFDDDYALFSLCQILCQQYSSETYTFASCDCSRAGTDLLAIKALLVCFYCHVLRACNLETIALDPFHMSLIARLASISVGGNDLLYFGGRHLGN